MKLVKTHKRPGGDLSKPPVEGGYWMLSDRHPEPIGPDGAYRLTCMEDVLHDSDARDLWTMWALRWFFILHDPLRRDANVHCASNGIGGFGVAADLWVYKSDDPGSCDMTRYDAGGDGYPLPTILEAIEAATRHLEPAVG